MKLRVLNKLDYLAYHPPLQARKEQISGKKENVRRMI
jgi:hypothetical protein